MQRAIPASVLLVFAMIASGAFAQRSGVEAPPQNTPWTGIPLLSGPQPNGAFGSVGTGSSSVGHRPFRHHRINNNAIWMPYGYAELYWSDASEYGPVSPAPAVVVVEKNVESAKPFDLPSASPQLIDVPKGMLPAKPAPPTLATVFILVTGERLETNRYTLTANQLDATVDGQQFTIPTSDIDAKATTTANRERGIELLIPDNRSEVSISF